MRLNKLVMAALFLSWPTIAVAQQTGQSSSTQSSDKKQEDPIAAAAQRTRQQKKDQPKATKVWDNDNIPSKPDAITVLGVSDSTAGTEQNGTAAASDGTAATQTASPDAAKKTEAESKERAAISAELAEAKEHLQSLNTDLDILTRKNALDQQMYYNNPDYASDKDGAAKLKDEQDEIETKKQDIAGAQKKIDELTAKLNESAADNSKPATNPQ